jgi:hypothetical protein
VQVLLHVDDNGLDRHHDRLFNPTVEARIVQAEVNHVLGEGEVLVSCPLLFLGVKKWLLLSDDLSEVTDDSED